MDIFAQLDEARRRTNVLDHPFYQRWSAGELTGAELAVYAGEYRHAVRALAVASRLAAEKAGPEHAAGLARHAEEEESHVELWERFADAVGATCGGAVGPTSGSGATGAGAGTGEPPAYPGACAQAWTAGAGTGEPLTHTSTCAQAWTAGDDLLEHLAVLYTIEASQPAISTTKLHGLATHYGIPADSRGAEYFTLHADLDVEHARQARQLIERLLPEDAGEREAAGARMLARASAALEGNWRLLDGVEAQRAAA